MAFVRVRRTSDQFRWEGLQQPQNTPLFPGLVSREFGRGEFRGLEFLHVEAKRIINEVPAMSQVPFRWTINAYRGCQNACVYCMAPETPVLMADGRTKAIRDVRPGDRVYGTEFDGKYHRYITTDVLDHWETMKSAYRVRLEDGTELIASADHQFLTALRGWKHVTGAEQGALRRPHLTTNNDLLGTGGFAVGPKCAADYRRGYLCGMFPGDGTRGVYERITRHGHRNVQNVFRLALADGEALRRTRGYLADHDMFPRERVFQSATETRREVRAIDIGAREQFALLDRLIEWPRVPTDEWCRGFLAGIFDAEGSCSQGVMRICNKDPEILDWIGRCMDRLSVPWVLEPARGSGCRDIRVTGGLKQRLRFFHLTDPAITRKRSIEGMAIKSDAKLRVVSIEPLGVEIPMYDITTGTGDFIANGVVSHNCFARPTHEYLNLDLGRGFETKIVVKVNAVERVRGELRPNRWAGEHIAMGTNTDPYQRAEGKYRLTRGIIEVLSEHRNPFSILTKGTLILRDVDLLAEAAERTQVAANFSIGTLDPDVWKATEPGAPHPRQRVEAVARLNDAGIPCGVLVAPILPGLSDGDHQIDEVVKACVEAGARSISGMTLHLRPGVREHYLSWLGRERPDLVRRHHEIYRRGSYAPKDLQRRISDKVHAAIERHGGLRARPGEARRVLLPPTPPLPPEPAPAEQLGLGL